MQFDKKKFIKDYLNEGKVRLELAEFALKKGNPNTAIRECQDSVELVSKCLLIAFGLYVPEKHEIKEDIKDIVDLFSKDFQKDFEGDFYSLLKELRREREPAYYGDVFQNISPAELYTKEDAQNFINRTKKFYSSVRKELLGYLK